MAALGVSFTPLGCKPTQKDSDRLSTALKTAAELKVAPALAKERLLLAASAVTTKGTAGHFGLLYCAVVRNLAVDFEQLASVTGPRRCL